MVNIFSFTRTFLVLLVLMCSCKKDAQSTDGTSPGGKEPVDQTPEPPGNTDAGDGFLYGSNMGWFPGWTDEQVAELLVGNPSKNIKGAGVNSLRPAMYDYFVEEWGYDIRKNAFDFYTSLGAKDNVLFVGYPSEAHRDKTKYCGTEESKIFANLYEPIWISNGVINEKNYYARYVYNLAKTYGPYVKYWEVWNEPDFTGNWQASQTWAQTNPNPCDLVNLKAPIQRYIRMLRITFEVIKAVDAKDYVCVGGIGYEGFLEAILRNTDNPADGSVSGEYSKKGGEWFDGLSYHIYPMYTGAKNSDESANSLITQKDNYQKILDKHGYDGTRYALKRFIITESNIPRKAINNYLGSDEAQRNFMIKAAVACQKAGIKGLYIYGVADNKENAQATDPYDVMGFYQPVKSTPYNVTANSSATSWRTVSTLLQNRSFDKAATAALVLPSNVDGGAFYSASEKNYVYVLWAKLTGSSESAAVSYTFPSSLKIQSATTYNWEGQPGQTAGQVNVTASPLFIKP